MEMNYCRRCGTSLTHASAHTYKCANGHTLYVNASPAAGIFLVNNRDEVVVAIRAIDPGKGGFDCPGGFLDGAETLEEALTREVQEEIGISPDQYDTPKFLASGIDPYEFNGETRNVLSCIFWARLRENVELKPQDDIAAAQLTPLKDLEPSKFFFPAVQQGAAKLKELLS